MQEEHARAIRRKKRVEKLWVEAAWGVGAIMCAAMIGLGMALVVEDRIQKYPHLGDGWIPKTEEQRRIEALPKRYIGR
jgi:hypothetical protein